jgi:urea transport system permease protein
VGGRGTLVGAVLGAVLVNGFKSWFTGAFPEVWLFALGTLFIVVTLFLPRGIIGTLLHRQALTNEKSLSKSIAPDAPVDEGQRKLERAGA